MKKLILMAAAFILLSACNEPKAETPTKESAKIEYLDPSNRAAKSGIQSISWNNAIQMNQNGAMYLDVRTPQELREGFAPNALNIPLNELSDRFGELPKDKDILVYCRSGRRSEIATKFLMDKGFTRVYNVLGGFSEFPKN